MIHCRSCIPIQCSFNTYPPSLMCFYQLQCLCFWSKNGRGRTAAVKKLSGVGTKNVEEERRDYVIIPGKGRRDCTMFLYHICFQRIYIHDMFYSAPGSWLALFGRHTPGVPATLIPVNGKWYALFLSLLFLRKLEIGMIFPRFGRQGEMLSGAAEASDNRRGKCTFIRPNPLSFRAGDYGTGSTCLT